MNIAETNKNSLSAKTFDSIVSWIEEIVISKKAPGLIVGISGTDSILTFLACAQALKKLGKQHRLLGLHFCSPHQTGNEQWVKDHILPWLKEQAPEALIEINDHQGYDDDNIRWGRLFSRAISDTPAEHSLTDTHYFPVGTRNATEDYLGTYTLISNAVSIMPIVRLYKSDVLDLCAYLGVPKIALDKSREVDCACGRYETAANYLNQVDDYIRVRQGVLSKSHTDAMPPDIKSHVMEYVIEEVRRNGFRKQVPYKAIPQTRG